VIYMVTLCYRFDTTDTNFFKSSPKRAFCLFRIWPTVPSPRFPLRSVLHRRCGHRQSDRRRKCWQCSSSRLPCIDPFENFPGLTVCRRQRDNSSSHTAVLCPASQSTARSSHARPRVKNRRTSYCPNNLMSNLCQVRNIKGYDVVAVLDKLLKSRGKTVVRSGPIDA